MVESLVLDAVAVLGDNRYEYGELANFTAVFEPTWSRFRQITHPAVGNHWVAAGCAGPLMAPS